MLVNDDFRFCHYFKYLDLCNYHELTIIKYQKEFGIDFDISQIYNHTPNFGTPL